MSVYYNYCLGCLEDDEWPSSSRFSSNHTKFSLFMQPVYWIDRICRRFGYRAYSSTKSFLKEFDAAAPLDECIGTREELEQNRKLLESFCRGIDNNPFFSPIGRFLHKRLLLDYLKNRKKVLKYYHLNKAFIEDKGKLKAPVIITGMHRSGTTFLQRLISEDPNTRSPYTFELEVPTPPMPSDVDPLRDPRIKIDQWAADLFSLMIPGFWEKFVESHPWSPTEKEESFTYMLNHNGIFLTNLPLAGSAYKDAFVKMADKRTIFRYERLFFTMLDAYRPAKSHWTFKAPIYAAYFPYIFEEYPDARVVVTHRTPNVTLPSTCRLLESFTLPFIQDGVLDKYRFGEFVKQCFESCLTVPFNYRKAHPERDAQIVDCLYEEFISDPIAMVKKIYQKFDLAYTVEFETNMMRYLENNRQGKFGRHKYSMEEYGFQRQAIYADYAEYMKQYGFGTD